MTAPARQRTDRDGVRLIRTGMEDQVVLGDIAWAIRDHALSFDELAIAVDEHRATKATPTPPRDDAGVLSEDEFAELLSEHARAAEDETTSHERGDSLGRSQAHREYARTRRELIAAFTAARQRIAAVEQQIETMRALAGTPDEKPVGGSYTTGGTAV